MTNTEPAIHHSRRTGMRPVRRHSAMRNTGQKTAGKSLSTNPMPLHVHAADQRSRLAARSARKAASVAKMS